jgi:hypothetical protein
VSDSIAGGSIIARSSSLVASHNFEMRYFLETRLVLLVGPNFLGLARLTRSFQTSAR